MHCLCAEVWFWGEPVLILILELFKCRSKSCSNKGITAGWTVTIFFYSVTIYALIFLVWHVKKRKNPQQTIKDDILWTHYLFRYYIDVATISTHPLSIAVYPTQVHGGAGVYACCQWAKARLHLCEVVKSVWHIETNNHRHAHSHLK